jgi:hypothetical protein
VANYVVAGVLLVFIVVVLVILKRYDSNRNRKPGD